MASKLELQEAMEDNLRHMCLATGTLRKYKRHREGLASFLSNVFVGGLQEVKSQDALVHYIEKCFEKVKGEGEKLNFSRTGSFAMVHVARAFARIRGEMCRYDSVWGKVYPKIDQAVKARPSLNLKHRQRHCGCQHNVFEGFTTPGHHGSIRPLALNCFFGLFSKPYERSYADRLPTITPKT